jgi:hypothetical protein
MNRKVILSVVFAVILIAVLLGVRMYFKPHASVKNEEAAFRLSAAELIEAFTEDEMAANARYGGKILLVDGTLTDVSRNDNSVILHMGDSNLMAGISCYLRKDATEHADLKTGSPVRVKGFCNGMLIDVVLDNCIVLSEDK